MNCPINPLGNLSPEAAKFLSNLRMVKDAISRAEDNLADGQLSPASCAYIDGQLSKAIGWLASCRAIVVCKGDLSDPRFDSEGVWDLDDEIVISDAVRLIDRAKGSSHE